VCTLPFFNRTVQLKSPFQNTKIEYQPISAYLPPLNTGRPNTPKSRKGEPKLARQEILSVPPQPDNTKQTVITPPKVKLQQDVALPNIVAWTPIPAKQPIAASSRSVNQLTLPQFDIPVVQPAADLSKLHAKLDMPTLPQPAVVEPAPDLSKVKPKLQAPALPVSVVEPPLSPDQLKLKAGQINMAQMDPQVVAPKLAVPAQHASGVTESGQAGKGTAQAVPAQPNVANLPGSSQGQGQLIALGLNPADVRGPVSVPSGSRSGEFNAAPGGKPDAPGTPNIVGTGSNKEPNGSGKASGAPPGIFVAAPPPGAPTSSVAGAGGKLAPGDAQMEARKRIIAAAMGPNLPNIHHNVEPPPPATDADTVEQRVFGNKPFYSVILNMPNLTSATGSWIIRYAELRQTLDKATLTAPIATTKVDPAYPPDVLRDRVEGTVTLYAVIHMDGSVSNIKVLNSLDSRLDQNAARALAGWHFRPGTKNGEPVDIEAVVLVPFRLQRFQ
jgi:TonB family protein